MAESVLMPKAGISVETCLIGAWQKKVGERVAVGETLFSYETDKAAFECESTAEGTLLEIFYGDGEEAPVLTPVCAIGTPGEDVSGLRGGAAQVDVPSTLIDAPSTPADVPSTPADVSVARIDVPSTPAAVTVSQDGMPPAQGGAAAADAGPAAPVSKRAKRLAERLGLDAGLASASGPHGRVIERDIEALADRRREAAAATAAGADTPAASISAPVVSISAPASGAGYTDTKLPQIRRAIAAAMMKSLSEMAQLTHHHSFDATRILALRAEFKQNGAAFGAADITLGDIILFAVSRVLREFPDINAHLIDGVTMRRFEHVNLGVAIDTERGLLVPTVFDADRKSLLEISNEVKALAKAARSGNISPDLLRGGTFTVSNLGATGVEVFTPIINPPQVAILGVCGITTRPRVKPDGGLAAYSALGLSLTYDHRAVDGAPASRFAQRLCSALEHIDMIFSS